MVIKLKNKYGGEIMCSVGDTFNIDIAEGIVPRKYKCKDCKKQFKGIGTNPKCPECHSANTETI